MFSVATAAEPTVKSRFAADFERVLKNPKLPIPKSDNPPATSCFRTVLMLEYVAKAMLMPDAATSAPLREWIKLFISDSRDDCCKNALIA